MLKKDKNRQKSEIQSKSIRIDMILTGNSLYLHVKILTQCYKLCLSRLF